MLFYLYYFPYKKLTCPCEETINGIDLKLTNEYINKKSFGNIDRLYIHNIATDQPIGCLKSGKYKKYGLNSKKFGRTHFGVKHAYWESENKCVALKKSEIKKGMRDPITFMDLSDVRKLAIEREVEVLEYINKNVNDDKRNYIIKMFGYEERNNGKNLRQYYDEKIKEQGGEVERRENEELLLKIIKGAAKALEQFHNFGVHGDNPELDFIEVKIIDFNLSIVGDLRTLLDTGLLSRPFKAPEIKNTDNLTRAADIWAFGQMCQMTICGYEPSITQN
ncbi:Protein kinase domain-containing protein [Meloidogyne graminicola]|uniref:Protein kinase domain-containing protein n=1 Tax=Meloidogyne graminicola TaxID=189291 RepID=A0A8S9ZHF2_9BILA|nr:Protein kinase domain-containing protein [Meloidogyne graminicola]